MNPHVLNVKDQFKGVRDCFSRSYKCLCFFIVSNLLKSNLVISYFNVWFFVHVLLQVFLHPHTPMLVV